MCENISIKDQTNKTNQTNNTNNQIPNKYNSREERGGADEIISLIIKITFILIIIIVTANITSTITKDNLKAELKEEIEIELKDKIYDEFFNILTNDEKVLISSFIHIPLNNIKYIVKHKSSIYTNDNQFKNYYCIVIVYNDSSTQVLFHFLQNTQFVKMELSKPYSIYDLKLNNYKIN